MKTLNATLSCLFFAASLAVAGPETIVRERAKNLNEQNQNRPVEPPPSAPGHPPAQPGQPAPAPAVPAQPTPGQRLQASIAAIKTNATVTAAQKQELARNLSATIQSAKKPSNEAMTKLAGNLSAALAENALARPQQARLAQNLITLFNGASLPPARKESLIEEVKSLLGPNNSHAAAVAADLKSIVESQPAR